MLGETGRQVMGPIRGSGDFLAYVSPSISASTLDATKCVKRILDAKQAKADLQSIVKNNCKHLSADHQKKLLQLLIKFESLFDGILGDWKTKPVSFQLKEGASPYHGRAFPVPKIHKDGIIK